MTRIIRPTVSIIIPTFREESYIIDTLVNLSKQNMWPNTEVIIVDYDPDGKHPTLEIMKRLPLRVKKKVKTMKTNHKGIGFARHAGAVGSTGSYLMSFDADAMFNDNDSVHRMVKPLMEGYTVLTFCNNRFHVYEELEQRSLVFALQRLPNALRSAGISKLAHEIGLTMTRDAYFSVGGYKDIPMNEAMALTQDVTRKYGQSKMKFVGDVTARVSARRVTGSDELLGSSDYNIAYR